RVLAAVFELRPFFEWRGLGFISQSALQIRDAYAEWDTEKRFSVPGVRITDPKAAQCGEVLKGVLKPHECKLFGRECTPERPVGAWRVSWEGPCAACNSCAPGGEGVEQWRCPISGRPAGAGRSSPTRRSRWRTAPAESPPAGSSRA